MVRRDGNLTTFEKKTARSFQLTIWKKKNKPRSVDNIGRLLAKPGSKRGLSCLNYSLSRKHVYVTVNGRSTSEIVQNNTLRAPTYAVADIFSFGLLSVCEIYWFVPLPIFGRLTYHFVHYTACNSFPFEKVRHPLLPRTGVLYLSSVYFFVLSDCPPVNRLSCVRPFCFSILVY